jgi:hypothetical protein
MAWLLRRNCDQAVRAAQDAAKEAGEFHAEDLDLVSEMSQLWWLLGLYSPSMT